MDAPFHQIVVPTDFSAAAEQAVRVGSELSRLYSAPLTLVHVYDPTAYPLPDGYTIYSPAMLAGTWEELERRLARAKADAEAAGAVRPQTRLLEGLTAAEIVGFAKDGGFDLIVLGTHGRQGVARLLLGSVAARVVQMAECPVLTVKPVEQRIEASVPAPAAAPAPS